MVDRNLSPAEVWQTALGELQLQLPRETFDTWLRHARLVAHEDGTFIIGVHNIYAREWLEHRLKKVILRTVGRIAQRTVELRFVVAAEKRPRPNSRREKARDDVSQAGPLLANLERREAPPQFERLAPGETGLNPRQTFDTFAPGPCNNLAYTAALAVVESAAQFNPLYIHAGVGLGKTHLLHAIGNACRACERRVLYVSAETFINDMVGAIRGKSTGEFRSKYREVDVLLVDDVQFLAGKDSTQEEFYHTFNALHNANAQIVIAAGGPPDSIRNLDGRLRSRFEGGLVIHLEPPDFHTRLNILELKAEQRSLNGSMPFELLERVAQDIEGSVRDLEGALNRLIATSLLTRQAPTLSEAEEVLDRLQSSARTSNGLALEDIVMAVADHYEVSADDLCGRGRSREVSGARQVAMYIAHRQADIPLQQIGEAMDGRNHSTVLYSCDRVEDLMRTDSLVRRQVQAILRSLGVHSPVEA